MLTDDRVLALFDFGIIESGIFAMDSFLLGVDEALPNVRGLEQSLGRDATHQQTGSSQPGLPFDKRRLQSVLGGTDSRGVAARATPNDNQIVGHFFHST